MLCACVNYCSVCLCSKYLQYRENKYKNLMGSSKKRGRKSKEEVERRSDNQNSNGNEEEQLPVPW